MLLTVSALLKRAIFLSALALTGAFGYMFFVNRDSRQYDSEQDGEDGPELELEEEIEEISDVEEDTENFSDVTKVVNDVENADATAGIDGELLDIEEKLMEIRKRLSHFEK